MSKLKNILIESVYDDVLKAVPDNYSYKDLADVVANIIKNEYGSHNIKPFMREIGRALKEGKLNEAPMVQAFPKMKVDKTVRTISYIRQEIQKIENVQKLRDPGFSKYKNEFKKVERALTGLANGIQRHGSILASEATLPKFKTPYEAYSWIMNKRGEAMDIEDEMRETSAEIQQLYGEMEQEAEPAGGPIADRFGKEIDALEEKHRNLRAEFDQIMAEIDEYDQNY